MSETLCGKVAEYRYTWPGRDEAVVCEVHARKLLLVSNAIGCYVQLIPIEDSRTCDQKVEK